MSCNESGAAGQEIREGGGRRIRWGQNVNVPGLGCVFGAGLQRVEWGWGQWKSTFSEQRCHLTTGKESECWCARQELHQPEGKEASWTPQRSCGRG